MDNPPDVWLCAGRSSTIGCKGAQHSVAVCRPPSWSLNWLTPFYGARHWRRFAICMVSYTIGLRTLCLIAKKNNKIQRLSSPPLPPGDACIPHQYEGSSYTYPYISSLCVLVVLILAFLLCEHGIV